MSKRFDELFADIVNILRRDWAGRERLADRFDPRYYNTAVGQAWRDGRLTELLFLQYMSQMLACTGDRHLRLDMRPTESYTPWSPGFFTRRQGDSLYVTAVFEETRLRSGDRITKINGGTPARHRARVQKNFFFSDEPEREDWRGFLKMADFIDVEHADGTCEQLELKRYPLRPTEPVGQPPVHSLPGGLILDLRNVPDMDEDEILSLLPRVCKADTPLSDLLDGDVYVNYTRLNSMIKAAGLQNLPGGEEYIEELRQKAGKGFLLEPEEDGTVIPGQAPETVVVLIDTWTRDGAETLALAAKRAGAALLGRPTLGTIDLCGDVSYELDERYVLTWPTAISKAACEGGALAPVAPDVYVPWTPEECARDVILDRAVRFIESK